MSLILFSRLSVLGYLFIVPFPHNAAGKNMMILAMILAVLGLLVQRLLQINWRSPVVIALLSLLAVILSSAVMGIDPLGSFNELRKHFLPGLLLFILIIAVFRDLRWQYILLGVIVTAMTIRAALALVELAIYLPDLSAARSEGQFVKGVALDATFYVPAIIGLIIWGGWGRLVGIVGVIFVMLVIALVQGRAPLISSIICILIIMLILKRWRILALTFSGLVIFWGLLFTKDAALQARFNTLVDAGTYLNALQSESYGISHDGLSGRLPIWLGVWEIASDRPVLGYGFGWKKLGKIAIEDGYVGRLQILKNSKVEQDKVNYFLLPADKVNPHNLYLQILFEAGWLGLLTYLLVLFVLARVALQSALLEKNGISIIGALTLGFFVDHLILGMANGLWIGLGPSMAYLGLLEVNRAEI